MALRQLVRIPVRWKSAISSPCCTRGLSSSTSSEPKIHHTQLGPNAQKYQLHPTVAHRAIHQTSALATDADDDNPEEAEEELLEFSEEEALVEQEIQVMLDDQYILPDRGHDVLIIQPDMKLPWRKKHLTSAEMQLEEACALVDSLHTWRVVDTKVHSLKHTRKSTLYGPGSFEEIKKYVQGSNATAVFVNIGMLTGLQLATMQSAFRLPVYDRYTTVLQIFKLRARTREAKLQVALAELPYLRSRLHGVHHGSLDRQKGSLQAVGGDGETALSIKLRFLEKRGLKLKRALQNIRDTRDILRKHRVAREIPSVAVVGYTNSGKTSLIKALTGERNMAPMDKLFATLDVTVHAGLLPNSLKVLYTDTVGFISDIPTELIASFAATLDDMLSADVIVHVRDISNPNHEDQKKNVEETLARMKLSRDLRDNIIEVGNKVDRLPSGATCPEGCLPVSATEGTGLDLLRHQIQDVLISRTARLRKKLRVKQGGKMLSWLRKGATVESVEMDPTSTEHLSVTAIFTEAQWGRFQSEFAPKKKTSAS